MDDVKIGEILLPGDEETQQKQEEKVRRGFGRRSESCASDPIFPRSGSAYYCAIDRETPLRVRGILLAALGYFVLPIDAVPDVLAVIGFTDDIAVLTTAFALINRHIKERHYDAADRVLADDEKPD